MPALEPSLPTVTTSTSTNFEPPAIASVLLSAATVSSEQATELPIENVFFCVAE